MMATLDRARTDRHRRPLLLVACVLALTPALVTSGAAGSAPGKELFACAGSTPSEESFPASAVNSPTGAEKAKTPAAEALRGFLQTHTSDGHPPPSDGYQVLADTSASTVFGHPPYGEASTRKPTGFFVTASIISGTWRVTSSGGCWPHQVSSTRLIASFDALATRPHVQSRLLRIALEPPVCGATPSLAGADLVWRAHALKVTVLLTMPQRGQGICAGVGHTVEYRVRLGRPLGHRAVLDGSRLPTALIARAPHSR